MKVQTALRLDKELLARVKQRAKAENRSLNNFIEYMLYKEVGDVPNQETKNAIEEARKGKGLKPIDDIDHFLDNI